ncbi:glycoside hydrolase domain-containing protein [Actinopolymorpha pittospori]|uniref:Rv2525c-like glycoside hydrolase-like domain-containing protein n=1 Tax=Actinopolymorpha pittospori TaxID=648752 RepID=A0A927RQN0_9ACTN|nr:hypothetical protein [Actinopolymorpha pittospori]
MTTPDTADTTQQAGSRRAARRTTRLSLSFVVAFAGGVFATSGAVPGPAVAAGQPVASERVVARGEPAARPAAGDALDARSRAVIYRGLRLAVPAGWEVHDLEAKPDTCVRFDRPALYLGTPGADQDCPAHAVGRTESLLIEPATAATAVASVAEPGEMISLAAAAGVTQEIRYALSGTGLALTAAFGERPELLDAVLRGVRYEGPERRTPSVPTAETALDLDPSTAAQDPAPLLDGKAPTVGGALALNDPVTLPSMASTTRLRGSGFDACAAPSLQTMRAWLASPHRGVGIYIGGVNRACPDGNLDATWVRSIARLGWRTTPIYVGRQAPCAFQDDLGPIRSANPGQQGIDAAVDAMARAKKFGLGPGTAIYFDMEGYDNRIASCSRIVLTFLSAWTKRLHDGGYLSGVYSSAASGISDLSGAYLSSTYVRPDAVWIARWDGRASVWGERYAPNDQWGMHQRIKQYRGPHVETWGGRSIEIDSNRVDGPQGAARFWQRVISRGTLWSHTGPGTAYPVVRGYAPGRNVDVVCQTTGSLVGTTRVWSKFADGTYVSDLHLNTPNKRGFSAPIPECRYPYAAWANGGLIMRAGPATSYPRTGLVPYGGMAYVRCQRAGMRIGPSAVWNLLDDGRWVFDWYTLTPGRPGFTAMIPRCP